MSYSECAKMEYVYPQQWNKGKGTSLFLRKMWGKSSLKEIYASLEQCHYFRIIESQNILNWKEPKRIIVTVEEVRESRNIPTDLHQLIEHNTRDSHQCWRNAHFAVKKEWWGYCFGGLESERNLMRWTEISCEIVSLVFFQYHEYTRYLLSYRQENNWEGLKYSSKNKSSRETSMSSVPCRCWQPNHVTP